MSKHEDARKPSVLEIEGNIRVAREWGEAIRSGTFHGVMAMRIATLLDFLNGQEDFNRKQLEEVLGVMPETATVDFGKKPEASQVAA